LKCLGAAWFDDAPAAGAAAHSRARRRDHTIMTAMWFRFLRGVRWMLNYELPQIITYSGIIATNYKKSAQHPRAAELRRSANEALKIRSAKRLRHEDWPARSGTEGRRSGPLTQVK